MKTNKTIQPSVAITLDDIIFSNRNQAYGAYYLRKKYNKHLLYALLLIIILFGTGATIPLIWNFIFPGENEIPVPPFRPPVVYQVTKTIDVPLPPPQKTDPPKDLVKITSFGIYKPVDSVANNDTTKHRTIPLDNPNTGNGTDSLFVNVDTSIIPPVDPVFTFVEESATFNKGTLKDFHDWVQKNAIYPSEASGIGLGGKVFLNFVVNKQGEVCDVNILKGVHSSINNETVRVLLSSPKWRPAKQNGHPVKQRFYMQVTFKLQ